ncbi:MAG: DNA cytosine methyltransferase [Bryobacterales bacterium]|nr:DNA cytosine methyltransferase [Bryobacterales bacterium]
MIPIQDSITSGSIGRPSARACVVSEAPLVYGSVCSGIEAVTLAWEPLGFRPAWFAEIDPFCSALLAYRFPHVVSLGDFTAISEDSGPIDVLAGGTPCPSFSIAGRRGGMDDPRGKLALEFCRLAGRLRPRWIVWENVPGVLSSNGGRDFESIVGTLADLGYGCAWRVLDAQFLGVPQRRRRVFVVGHLGDWRRAAAVLLERESLRGNPPARRKAKEEIAGTLGGGAGERGWCDDPDRAGAFVSMSLNAKGGSGRIDGESETFIAHPLSGEGYDASEDGTGRGTPLIAAFSAKDSGADAGDLAPTLRAMPHDRSHANGGGQIAVCVQEGQTGVREYDTAGTVRADAPGTQPGGSLLRVRMAVRRLTPRECERLQGMPDDWTLVPYRGKLAADGPRYRAIGNSMAVPVMRWIGRRMQVVEAISG